MMKKLILVGLVGGLFIVTDAYARNCPSGRCSSQYNESRTLDRYGLETEYTTKRMAKHNNQVSETMLLSQINKENRKLYHSMSEEGKALALRLATQTGRESMDKNLAVEKAWDQMYEHRQDVSTQLLQNGMNR